MADPDWLTHILAAWVLCRLMRLKFKQFDARNTAIVMAGALLPDMVKVAMVFDLFGLDIWNYVNPLHSPFGVLLTGGLASLLFRKSRLAYGLLVLGASTHLALDFLLKFVVGGMPLLFPFSWNEWQLKVIQSDDYRVTVVAVVLAVVVFAGLRLYEGRAAHKKEAAPGE